MAKAAVTTAVLYTLIAAFSTAVKIGSQMLSMWAYKGIYAVGISILIGTPAGLPLR